MRSKSLMPISKMVDIHRQNTADEKCTRLDFSEKPAYFKLIYILLLLVHSLNHVYKRLPVC